MDPARNINVDLIIQEYGRFYENSGQGMDRLKRALMTPATTLENYATRINTRDDIFRMATEEWGEVLQPFRISFEPNAKVKFIPNAITLDHIKVDAEFAPMAIYHSWMAFLASPQNRIEDWPITRYFVEVYLKAKIDNDREMKAVYKGVRDDEGDSPESCMDGIKAKLIQGANDPNNPINVIQGVDAFTEENIFDEIEAYDRKIDELYDGENIIHFVAPKWVRAMKTAKRAAGYYFISSPDQINAEIDFTKHVVCGVPSMKGTDDIFSTMKENLLWLTNRDKFDFDIQKHDRYIHVLADWMEGIGFGCNAMVWTSARTVGQDGTRCSCGPDGERESITDSIQYVVDAINKGAVINKVGDKYHVVWVPDTPEMGVNVQTVNAFVQDRELKMTGSVSGPEAGRLANAYCGFYIAPWPDLLVPQYGKHMDEGRDDVRYAGQDLDGSTIRGSIALEDLPEADTLYYRATVHYGESEYYGQIKEFVMPEPPHNSGSEGGSEGSGNAPAISVVTDEAGQSSDTVRLDGHIQGWNDSMNGQVIGARFFLAAKASDLIPSGDGLLNDNCPRLTSGPMLLCDEGTITRDGSVFHANVLKSEIGNSLDLDGELYYTAAVILNGAEYRGNIRKLTLQ